ncbi:MAG: alpha/beta hydrolase [Proteobacteria bacterium]|nr:MAG: alpha/beta hydrolase [Pseudomonadota bacterium]
MELQVNGVSVYVATGGKVFDNHLPNVLFLHGSGMDHRVWAGQIQWFADNGCSVLAPDLPGHGLSAGEPLQSIKAMGTWLLDFLNATGMEKVHVIGHSQGFLVALELAHQAAEKVASLSGIGTAATIPVNPALIETAQAAADKAVELMLKWGFGAEMQSEAATESDTQTIAKGREIITGNPLATDLIACSRYTVGVDIAESLTVPTCFILAEKDRMTPLAAGEALAALTNAQVTVLPRHGHMLPMEAPQACIEVLQGFINHLTQ